MTSIEGLVPELNAEEISEVKAFFQEGQHFFTLPLEEASKNSGLLNRAIETRILSCPSQPRGETVLYRLTQRGRVVLGWN